MAQRKSKSKPTGKGRKQGGGRKPAEKQPPQPDGVVVAVTLEKNGDKQIGLQTLGKTTDLEVPALLRQCAIVAEKRLGIE